MYSFSMRAGDSMTPQKQHQLAQSRRVAPGRGYAAHHYAAETAHLAKAMRLVVEDRREMLAEVLDDTARERRTDAFDLGSQIALQRCDSSRTQRLEVIDAKLMSVARMGFEAAVQAQCDADLDAGKIAHDRQRLARILLVDPFETRDHVAAVVVDEQDLRKRAFD